MARVAALAGSPGPLAEALEAELGRRGWEVRLPLLGGGAEAPDLGAARGAEVLFHLGLNTPRDAQAAERAALEAGFTRAVAEAALRAEVRRLVLVSTVSVYGRPRNLPCREGELKAPRTDFGRARWAAEREAWRAFRRGVPLAVLRPTLTYGPTIRGGPMRTLALFTLIAAGRGSVPIIRRGPVEHLVHLDDVVSAAALLAEHPDDRDVVGRAFNVADEAPLPLAELQAAAVEALGRRPGRVLPYSPRLFSLALWLVRRIPDRILLEPVNRRLAWAWGRLVRRAGASPAVAPRIDREFLHWVSADHYYDVARLAALGWRARHPVSAEALPEALGGVLGAAGLPRPAA